ncbi:MAG: OsmC family protein [Leptospiraceae bacterium]|nr:OsmC family protein [Leptospiraceae bacterium]
MRVSLDRIEHPYHMVAKNETGNTVSIDASPSIGGKGSGARPMELLLMGLASCSGIDVLNILYKQRQEVNSFHVDVDGKREEGKEANVFVQIHVHFKLSGNIEPGKLEHAIKLSLEKYCSVAKTLEKTATITHSYTIE